MMRSTPRALLALVLLSAGPAACTSDGSEPTGNADVRHQAVTASLDAGALVVQNHADFTVRVGVLDAEYARTTLALWCFGADECGTPIEAGATLRVPLSDVAGYAPGSEELLVHWWDPRDNDDQVSKFSVIT